MSGTGRRDKFKSSLGHCAVTGKAKYKTRKIAKVMMRRYLPAEHLSAYRCRYCGTWHFGHLPGVVTRGDVTRYQFTPEAQR